MALLTYSDVSKFNLRNRALWLCTFSNSKFNKVGGKAFPATSVNYDSHRPRLLSGIDGGDFPLGISSVAGTVFPRSVSITFLETDKMELTTLIDNWIRGKLSGSEYNASGRVAIAPKNLLKVALTLTIQKYADTGELLTSKQFYVIPAEGLKFQEETDVGTESYTIELEIVGIASEVLPDV